MKVRIHPHAIERMGERGATEGEVVATVTYDPTRNIAYLRLHEKKAQVDTIRVSDEMNVDIAPEGTVYGIELLNANDQLEAEDDGNLVVINDVA